LFPPGQHISGCVDWHWHNLKDARPILASDEHPLPVMVPRDACSSVKQQQQRTMRQLSISQHSAATDR
jgi:hypothetical protein